MSFDGLMATAVADALQRELAGGRINKIYQLSSHEILMTIRANRKNQKLLISTHSTYGRVQITTQDYQYPDEPPMFCMFLRKQLEGGIITDIQQISGDRIIRLSIRHVNELGDQTMRLLYIEIMGKHSNLILTDTSHRILDTIKHISPLLNRHRSLQPGAQYILPPAQDKLAPFDTDWEAFQSVMDPAANYAKQLVAHFQGFSPLVAKEIVYRSESDALGHLFESFQAVLAAIQSSPQPALMTGAKEVFYLIPIRHLESTVQIFSTLWEMFDRYYFGKEDRDRIKQHFSDIDRFISHEYDKNLKKKDKLYQDLEQTEKAESFKILGDLIFANLHQIPRGAARTRVQNFYSADLALVDIELNPQFSASDNAQKYFQKYQKAKNAVAYILEQLEATEKEIAYFDLLKSQIESAGIKDVYEMKEELEMGGYLRKRQSRKRKSPSKPTLERYVTSESVEIFVAKNNLQNDYLTHKFARRHEWWFHAKDMPGSHVLVRSDADALSEETIRTAAHLAAYYSKGRQSSSVPVDYTRVRNIKKVPASHLGYVTYEGQKTIYIDPDEDMVMSFTRAK